MPAPRVEATEREAAIEYEGKTYKVKYVPIAAPVEIECRDAASVFSEKGQRFFPWKYLLEKTKRTVVEIDGERLDPSSLSWLTIPPEFMQLMQNAVFPQSDSFRSRIETGAPGKTD